jgi:hypothetical protein
MNTAAPIQTLLRDLDHEGQTLTQLYRSHRAGGRVVYISIPPPGITIGHKFHVFEVKIVDGCEQLGALLATRDNLDHAINEAAKPT